MAAFVAQALLLVAFCTVMTDKAMAFSKETVIYGLPDPNGPREAARHPFHSRKEYWPAHAMLLGSGGDMGGAYPAAYPSGFYGYTSDVRVTGVNAPVHGYSAVPMADPYYRTGGSDMYAEPRRERGDARQAQSRYEHMKAEPAAMRWNSYYDLEPRVVNTVSWAWDNAIENYGAPGRVLDATVNKPVGRATLDTIADSIYREAHGSRYGTVSINWHVGSNPEPGAPWARTVITK